MAFLMNSNPLPTIFNMSVTASVVILFVLLVRLLLKKSPKIFSYALWAVVLFRLLCPVSITTDFSLLGLFDAPVTETTEHTTALEYVPQDTIYVPNAEVRFPAVNNAVDDAFHNHGSTQEAIPDQNTAAPAPTINLLTIAAIVWLTGMGVMAVYSVVSFAGVKGKLIGAVCLRENIYLADYVDSPFVMGLIRPRIYLPSTLSYQEQGYIILHEQYHIRRGDHIIKALAFLALCIHWFNPLVWVAFVLSSKDMEMSCDEAVVKKMGEDIRHDYSASLLSLATGRRIIVGTPLAFGEGDTKSRIKNMLSWKQAKPVVILLSATAVILALIICGTNASTRSWYKIEHNARTVEISCKMENPILSYAIYEDIYEDGELISSTPRITDSFQEDDPREFSLSLTTNIAYAAPVSGFEGKLTCIWSSTGGGNWETSLPKSHYTGSGSVPSEGSGSRRPLEPGDSIVLQTLLFSTDPEGKLTVQHHDQPLTECNDTVVVYRLVTSVENEGNFDSTGEQGEQSAEVPDPVLSAEWMGEWKLDDTYTEKANGNIRLRDLYGTALGDYGASLQLSADGSMAYYIGLLSGNGTWRADGDTGRYIAEVTVHPGALKETKTLYVISETPGSSRYLVLDDGVHAFYWTQSGTESSSSSAQGLVEDAVYHLELAAGESFRNMKPEKLSETLAEYKELLNDYTLIARETEDGKTSYIVGRYPGNHKSTLHGMYGIEVTIGAEEPWQLLYREEDSETVETALAAQKKPSVGYHITDSKVYWSSDGTLVLIQPNDTELWLDTAWNRYLYTPNGREYIADAVSRGIDVCGRTDTFLYVYRIDGRFGEIAERIPLTEAEAAAILAEKRVKVTDGFGFAATLHINGEATYYDEHSGIPQTVLDLAVERCDYRFGDPGMITDTIREARLDCDWLDTPLYAGEEDLAGLREMLKNAEFGYVGACGYGAKLTLTFTGGEKLTVFKGTDGCDSIVFGSYGGYFLGDKENTEFWEMFGLDADTKQPLGSVPHSESKIFERGGLRLEVTNVLSVRTESMLAEGVTLHEYTVFTCAPGAVITVLDADMRPGEIYADGKPRPEWGLSYVGESERTRITEETTSVAVTPDLESVYHLEASLAVLKFEFND